MDGMQVGDQAVHELQRPHRNLAMACPSKRKKMEEKKINLRQEKERASETSYAGVAAATSSQTTKIQLSGVIYQKILACMIHAHLVNMGSPGTYQAKLNQLFEAKGLATIKVLTNPDSSKIFCILPSEKCQPNNYDIKTPTLVVSKGPETSEMEVEQVPDKEARDQSPSGAQATVKSRHPRKLKNQYREITHLYMVVPEFRDALGVRVLSTDNKPKLANVFRLRGKKERPSSILKFDDPRDVISCMETNMESPLSEDDVEYLFNEGHIQDNYEIRKIDAEVLRKARLG